MSSKSRVLSNRYDFLLLFDVQDGNPNGDPDAGNSPRSDPETLHGLVTDVSIKRRIRNWIGLSFDGQPPNAIYVADGMVLNDAHDMAWRSADGVGHEPPKSRGGINREQVRAARSWMCRNYWDVRAFGAVMNTESPAGHVRGPVQLTFARSVEPILQSEFTIGRVAVTNRRDAHKERTFGRKFLVPYGLYLMRGFINPFLALDTGFTEDDLRTLQCSLKGMFEVDRSAARGMMTTRAIYAFRHSHMLGDASAAELFSRVRVERRRAVDVARKFSDYEITVDDSDLPLGLSIEDWMRHGDAPVAVIFQRLERSGCRC